MTDDRDDLRARMRALGAAAGCTRSLSEDMAAYGKQEPPHPLLGDLPDIRAALYRQRQQAEARSGERDRILALNLLLQLVEHLILMVKNGRPVDRGLMDLVATQALALGVDPRNFERDRGR